MSCSLGIRYSDCTSTGVPLPIYDRRGGLRRGRKSLQASKGSALISTSELST